MWVCIENIVAERYHYMVGVQVFNVIFWSYDCFLFSCFCGVCLYYIVGLSATFLCALMDLYVMLGMLEMFVQNTEHKSDSHQHCSTVSITQHLHLWLPLDNMVAQNCSSI